MTKLSFTRQVKEELTHVQPSGAAARAELAGLVWSLGGVHVGASHQYSVTLETLYAGVIRKVFNLVKIELGIQPRVLVREDQHFGHRTHYVIQLDQQPGFRQALEQLGIVSAGGTLNSRVPRSLLRGQEARAAWLRGLFLGAGTVAQPGASAHLEIRLHHREMSELVMTTLDGFGIQAQLNSRQDYDRVYIKNHEMVSDLLKVMGARQAVFEYEEGRVIRTIRGQANRLVNAETANVSKAVEAGLEQKEDLELIEAEVGLENLPAKLQQLAELRLEHPGWSLRQLGEALSPPLSKSGVNHRMRSLRKMADDLRSPG